MDTRTLIVGAGQAGLALSHHLTDAGHDHLLLERGRVGERWRSERPDSFRLLTPNWLNGLPGYAYAGPDPDGFMSRQEAIDYFAGYAASFAAPVHVGVTVTAVEREVDGRWTVRTDHGTYRATDVVLATGWLDRPWVRDLAGQLPPDIQQVHSSRYRNPEQLAPGRVLVVGAGPSGQQVADELALGGRDVVLAAGTHRALPRRYRGADVYRWMQWLGLLDRTLDALPDPATATAGHGAVLTGGNDDLDLHRLHRHGVRITGRLLGVAPRGLAFGGGLARDLVRAERNADDLRRRVDQLVAQTGRCVPAEPWASAAVPSWAVAPPTSLGLADGAPWCGRPATAATGRGSTRPCSTPAATRCIVGDGQPHRGCGSSA